MSIPVITFYGRDGHKYKWYADGLVDGWDDQIQGLIRAGVNMMPVLVDRCFMMAVKAVLESQGKPFTGEFFTDDMRQLKIEFEIAVHKEFGHPDHDRIMELAIGNADKVQSRTQG
jgi:hypothetical protein